MGGQFQQNIQQSSGSSVSLLLRVLRASHYMIDRLLFEVINAQTTFHLKKT